MNNFDINSLMFLFMGKDNMWMPIIMLIMLIIQKWSLILNMYDKLLYIGRTEYTISGSIYTDTLNDDTYGKLNNQFIYILYYINNTVGFDRNILKKINIIRLPTHLDVFKDNKYSIILPKSGSIIKLNSYIQCKIFIEDIETNIKSSGSDINYRTKVKNITLILMSKTKLIDILDFITNIGLEYDNKLKIIKNKLSIVKPQYIIGQAGSTSILSYPNFIDFKSTKTFDNLFFDGKKELIKRLDSFVSRKKYSKLGLPETLGLLFYGDPGTGKTSCIKAIANYLNMNLIIAPMNKIKTKKQLEDLFLSSTIDIKQDKRIYVFEEIDCNGWKDIVKNRKLIKEESEQPNTIIIGQTGDTISVDNNKTKKDNDDDDKLTLGNILEIIDGIIECPGRIIIMTTNHKEYLDPALLRPGRIDMEIEFKKLRGEYIKELFKLWYEYDMDAQSHKKIPDYKYTQAEISQFLFKYENNPKAFINKITV